MCWIYTPWLGRIVCGSHNRFSPVVVADLLPIWPKPFVCYGRGGEEGESRAGRTQRLEDFIRWHPSRQIDEGPAVLTKCGLVETPGVEPGSEDRQCTASTCVDDRLDFAATHAHRQA